METKKETQKIIQYLKEINEIPRASSDEKAISDYLLKFAKDRGLEAWQDDHYNVYVKKPACGKENTGAVILQGHMDMVYVKEEDCSYAYEEGIKVLEDEEFLWADGTSLGADNGIAVAYCMALMDGENIVHPDLEMILTTEEEIGLLGAKASDFSKLEGKKLINMDSEEEGVFTISCAGGCRMSMFWDVTKEALPKEEDFVRIAVELYGLKGGHSGVNIAMGHANAIQLAGRMLHFMNRNYDYYIEEIKAVGKENIICKNLKMSLCVKASEASEICDKLKEFGPIFANEYSVTDTIQLKVERQDWREVEVYTKDLNQRLVSALLLMPNGIMDYSEKIEDLVETSMNMGAIEEVDGRLHLLSSIRSSVSTRKQFLKNKLQLLGEQFADEVKFLYEYPEWEYKENSELQEVACEAYRTIFGREAKVEAIHAGLECGYFYQKDSELDIISMGPDVTDVHTTEEKISKKSVGRTWGLLKEILHNV